jgi:hypothetical protein
MWTNEICVRTGAAKGDPVLNEEEEELSTLQRDASHPLNWNE